MQLGSIFAQQGYAASRATLTPEAGSGAGLSPQAKLEDGFRTFVETLNAGEEAALAAMQGEDDPHMLVQALAQTELAVETAVSIRNKVVEAYQEILRMPI